MVILIAQFIRPPPPLIADGDGRRTKGPIAVSLCIDAML